MEKSEIRRQMKKLRRELSDAEILSRSQAICSRLMRLPIFEHAKELFVYLDCKGEVSTRPLIEEAWRRNWKLAAPRVLSRGFEPPQMAFYYISSYEEIAPGYYGIPEPVTEEKAETEDALLVVPGVGFDKSCSRCGYGEGFYDCYLREHPHHPSVALAFDFQIVDQVPAGPLDVRPQILITESAVYQS